MAGLLGVGFLCFSRKLKTPAVFPTANPDVRFVTISKDNYLDWIDLK